jgi:uncharacterized membrane protein YeaQ/YmgE (transglycosylase-associated protein family)
MRFISLCFFGGFAGWCARALVDSGYPQTGIILAIGWGAIAGSIAIIMEYSKWNIVNGVNDKSGI